MSPREKRLSHERLRRDFAEWAKERGLLQDRHDAQFHGKLPPDETPLEIETGIRDANLYVVVVTIYRACGTACALHRDDETRADSPFVARLRPVFRTKTLRSVGIDAATITLRLNPGSSPDDVGDAVDYVMKATMAAETGPYR
jgi:hypothetical protein